MMKISLRWIIFVSLILQSAFASAWWNDDWSFRKKIQVDVTALPKASAGSQQQTSLPVIVRLHTGNFSYFGDVMPKGEDIRFLAGDDKTALKFSIEKYDPVNQIALIWVYLPNIKNAVSTGALSLDTIWMYYGNKQAKSGSDRSAMYGVEYGLVYHFDQNGVPFDASIYANQPTSYSSEILKSGFFGTAAAFNGSQSISIPVTPSIKFDPLQGWNLSMWIKIDKEHEGQVIAEMVEGDKSIQLTLNHQEISANYHSQNLMIETAKTPKLTLGDWHHVGIFLSATQMAVTLEGKQVSRVDGDFTALSGQLTIGSKADGSQGVVGQVDEVIVMNKTINPKVYERIVESQSIGSTVLSYGNDEQADSKGDEAAYFTAILSNVSLDGWAVILSLAAMFCFSLIIVVSKTIVLHRTQKDNRIFLKDFSGIDPNIPESLDRGENDDDPAIADYPVLQALFGKHDHYQSSSLYRLYHVGMQGLTSRLGKSVGAQSSGLSPQAIDAIKASLDASLVREQQGLNKMMVVLTIAISGGPFLGLLGTVLGVMITFAAIAVSGEVDINAIAPGISAALMTTVAGLAVAIPALFAYNFLSTRIRDLSIDMRVFVDELVARIAEFHQ